MYLRPISITSARCGVAVARPRPPRTAVPVVPGVPERLLGDDVAVIAEFKPRSPSRARSGGLRGARDHRAYVEAGASASR